VIAVRLSSAVMRLSIWLIVMIGGIGCGDRQEFSSPTSSSSTPIRDVRSARDAATPLEASARDAGVANTPEAAPQPLACDQRVASIRAAFDDVLRERQSCQWDHECVLVARQSSCYSDCPAPVVASQLVAARAAIAELDGAVCEGFDAADCRVPQPSCAEQRAYCEAGQCAAQPASAPANERARVEIPPQNARARSDDPPPRPEAGAAEERARRLFEAIVNDDPDRAVDFYLPRETFLELKGIADPGGYWDRLFPRYIRDIRALHQILPDIDRAEFLRFELVPRGGWVRLREEGNSLPYHVSRHSWIHYRVGEEVRRLEVRVLITWGNEWYITHLCEFHCDERECCRGNE
jgi:hypothetical protein